MKKQRKGFTVIELLVTIAILAILVLIGAPRLVGYLEKAELVRIQHDVKVMEQEMTTTMLEKEINDWQNNQKSLGSLIMKRQLYEKEGYAEKIDKRHLFIDKLKYQLASNFNTEKSSGNLGLGGDLIPINSEELGVGGNLVTEEEISIDKTYKVIPEEYSKKINTKLPGTFYTNSIGKVYYEHDKPLNIDDEKKELTCPSPLPDYDFQLINGKGTIVKWNGTELHLVIPEYFLLEVDGEEQCVPVQVIGTGAFQNGNLGSIKIPNTVEKIEDDAFADNDLENVDIPSGVEDIGNGAFENNDIPKVDIPHSVGSIGDNAFAGNNTKPTINNKPENVIIGNNAFDGNEPIYKNPTPEDVGVVFDPMRTIVAGEGNGAITIPAEIEVGGELYPVKEIGKGAYQGEGLISVKLPSTLERIEDYAFAGNQLVGVDIPHSVVYIGHYAFAFNEKVHSSNGDTKGTISFIKIYDQEQFHKLNDNGDIEENGTKVLSISNTSGKMVELKDYIFVTSSNEYVIDDDFVGDNDDDSNSNPDDGNSDDNSNPGEDVDPDPEPEPEPEPNPEYGYTQEQIDDLVKGEDKYVPVATAEELQHIANNLSTERTFGQGTKWEGQYVGKLDSKFIQVEDIDLSSIDNFKPIGDHSTDSNISVFRGIYDGGNFKITSLKIDRTDEMFVGLFGYTSGYSEGVTIKNVGLEEVNVNGSFATGGLIGYIQRSPYSPAIIKNSYVKGDVTSFGGTHTGGLIGYIRADDENSIIENSYTMATVKSIGSATLGSTGGLVGNTQIKTIKDSYATGSVTGGNQTGGLIGNNGGSSLENSYATGFVTGSGDNTGGLVGKSQSSSIISNSYSTGFVTGSGNQTGGLVGESAGSIIKDSYAEGKVNGKRSTGGLVGRTSSDKITNSYATGNVNGMNYTGGLVGYNGENTKIEKSHAIGTVEGTSQTGGLVGSNFKANISNSYATGDVTGTESEVGGLSGDNHQGGIIYNSYATGNVSGMSPTGGLVGNNQTDASVISDSYATGTVIGTGDATGGLAGENTGSINNSHATGASVNGEGINTGGLVGYNRNATIENSYSTANVTGKERIGGLVGENSYGTIRNSYAKGVASGERMVGGLVGKHMGNSSYMIENSYSTGKVNGTFAVGSLIGLMSNENGNSTKVENSYALKNANLPLVGISARDNNGSLSRNVVTNSSVLSDSEMKDENSYNNWDFTNVWEIASGSYPTLR